MKADHFGFDPCAPADECRRRRPPAAGRRLPSPGPATRVTRPLTCLHRSTKPTAHCVQLGAPARNLGGQKFGRLAQCGLLGTSGGRGRGEPFPSGLQGGVDRIQRRFGEQPPRTNEPSCRMRQDALSISPPSTRPPASRPGVQVRRPSVPAVADQDLADHGRIFRGVSSAVRNTCRQPNGQGDRACSISSSAMV